MSGTACTQDGDELHLISSQNLLTRCMQVLELGHEEVEVRENSSTPELLLQVSVHALGQPNMAAHCPEPLFLQ